MINALKILNKISLDNFNKAESDQHMTNKTEKTLIDTLQDVLTKSVKETKNQVTDISRLNKACTPYIEEQIKKGSNIKWTISEIQNLMKEKVEYAPKNKDDETYSAPFEMRVIASAEQIILKLEGVCPNEFGEYDKNGNWKEHPATVSSTNPKNYNVRFNSKKGFDFDKDGNLVLQNQFVKPVIENDVKVSDTVTKREKFANRTETLQQISKAVATGFFNRAYPQAKKKRTPNPITDNQHITNAETMTKFVKDINIIYVEYTKSGGKNGNAERLSEEDAKILMTLKNEIDTMLGNRGNAEDLAFEIEEGLKRKAV